MSYVNAHTLPKVNDTCHNWQSNSIYVSETDLRVLMTPFKWDVNNFTIEQMQEMRRNILHTGYVNLATFNFGAFSFTDFSKIA